MINKKIYWYNQKHLSLISFLLSNKYKCCIIDLENIKHFYSFTFFNVQYDSNYILYMPDSQNSSIIDKTKAIAYLMPTQKETSLHNLLLTYTKQYAESIKDFLSLYFNLLYVPSYSDINFNFYQSLFIHNPYNIGRIRFWLNNSEPNLNIDLIFKMHKHIIKNKKHKGVFF